MLGSASQRRNPEKCAESYPAKLVSVFRFLLVKVTRKRKMGHTFLWVEFNVVNDAGGAAGVIFLEPFHYCHSDQKKLLYLVHYALLHCFIRKCSAAAKNRRNLFIIPSVCRRRQYLKQLLSLCLKLFYHWRSLFLLIFTLNHVVTSFTSFDSQAHVEMCAFLHVCAAQKFSNFVPFPYFFFLFL